MNPEIFLIRIGIKKRNNNFKINSKYSKFVFLLYFHLNLKHLFLRTQYGPIATT